MIKEKYIEAEIQITEFETEDVITSSIEEPDLGPHDTEILLF